MKTLHNTIFILLAVVISAILPACIEDGVSTSPADQPEFSTDTLKFGEQFTGDVTVTHRLMVYNRHDKIMSISDISLAEGERSVFRLNVDGQSGSRFSGIEIRPNDSIYVLVSARLNLNDSYDPTIIDEDLNFVTNGVKRTVVLSALAMDVETLTDPVIDTDTRWDADHPRRIYGTLRVEPGTRLTLGPGVTLYFHDKASMQIDGTLIAEGTAEAPVTLRGDRLGSVVGDISFDLMASQWGGVKFSPTSTGNDLKFAEIRNTSSGVAADSTSLTMVNCRLRNSATNALRSNHSDLTAIGCEFAESARSPLLLHGGKAVIAHCTVSNYYLFSAISGALIAAEHTDPDHDDESGAPYLSARIENTILYGSSADLSPKDLTATDITLTNCLLRSNGTDDDRFISCIWGADPLFYTVRADYIFDYRLHPDSPAIEAAGASSVALPDTDFYGTPHPSRRSVGAYEAKADS
ncbi:MAG: hypothetical protein HDS53_06275 [Barnesiella sp.]|nr:hypothetical protein [Barnesiella sp.]